MNNKLEERKKEVQKRKFKKEINKKKIYIYKI